MSDDLLLRAARSLRDDADGGGPAPAGGRLQVVERIQAERRAASRRMAILVPVAILFVTSTAIAAGTGVLPEVWKTVQDLIMTEAPLDAPSVPLPRPPRTGGHVGRPPVAGADTAPPDPALAADEAPAPAEAAPEAPPEAPPETAPEAAELPRTTRGDRASRAEGARPSARVREARPLAAAADPSPAQPAPIAQPPDPTVAPLALTLFRAAERLHVAKQDWVATLAAWDAYLQAAPHGALVPEARWNRAICLLRLHRNADARAALLPFAGQDAGYREAEARALIEAMDATP